MQLLGVKLNRPTFGDITFAVGFATAIIVVMVFLFKLLGVPVIRISGIVLFLGAVWGALSNRLGIRLDQGRSHMLLFLLGMLPIVVVAALFIALH